jgi:hypothetical protein
MREDYETERPGTTVGTPQFTMPEPYKSLQFTVFTGRRETLSTAIMFQYNMYRDTDPKIFQMNLFNLRHDRCI